MVVTDQIRNIALSADVRVFMLVLNVRLPIDDQEVDLVPDSEFPFEVLKIKRRHKGESATNVDLLFTIDSADEIEFPDSGSPGVGIPCTDGVLVTSEPSGSYSLVGEGASLTCTFQNVDTGVQDVVIQVTCKRTQENLVVAE